MSAKLNDKMQNLFPGCNIVHLSSSFIKALPEYISESADKLFVNIDTDRFDVIYFINQNELRLMNRYEYKTPTDFIYFLLLCCEELKINREEIELMLIGGVDIQSKIYSNCYHYFPKISFIHKPEEIRFSKAFDRFPRHLHFNLYNLTA